LPRRVPQLAKLSRPRLYDAVPRQRLFKLLDDKRQHPAIWVCGPPGAGKTTLVGTYLEDRGIDGIWYQLDTGDREVTSFFYYLSRAVLPFLGKRKSLPVLAPEQLQNIEVFARRYFRELWDVLPRGCAIVLDNFQDVSDSADLLAIADVLISEVPDARHLLIISRNDPPQALLPQVARRQIAQIGWEALRLTKEETASILSTRSCTDETAETVFERSGGWVAGVVLMREHQQTKPMSADHKDAPESAVFDYFAAQIFAQQDEETRRVMQCVGYLPYFTEDMARELSGSSNAASVIDRLYQGQIFINRREGGEYQFHALLRAFLVSRARESLTATELARLQCRSAELMVQAGELDAAFTLYRGAGELQGTRRLVTTVAESLIRQGRWELLGSWLNTLGDQEADIDPWLTFWRGIVEMATDAARARSTFELAYARFHKIGNRTGELEAVSRILDTYFLVWDTVAEMDPWIEVAEELVRDDRPASDQAFARAYSGLLIALLYRHPHNPLLQVGAEWVAKHYERERDPTQRLRMAVFLLHFYDLMGEFEKATRVLQTYEPLLSTPEVAPLTRSVGWMRRAHHFAMTGDTAASLSASDKAVRICQENGLPDSYLGLLAVSVAHTNLVAGRVAEAEASLERARSIVSSAQRMITVYFHWAEFWCAVLKKDAVKQRALWDSFERLPMIGVPFNTAYNQPVIHYLVQSDQVDLARTRIDRWRPMVSGMRSPYVEFNMDLMEASVATGERRTEEAIRLLQRAFRSGAERGFENTLAWVPEMMAPLCALALEHGIEVDYVRHLIRARGLRSPEPTQENWPWPVKIHAFGRFAVAVDGKPVTFQGRPQHRTLELLKAIVALEAESVSVAQVTNALWPDSDGDAAHRAFAVALHRLRKLLGDERAIRLSDGTLSVDRSICWVDVLALDERVTAIENVGQCQDPQQAVRQLFDLYRGHLLGDDEAQWVSPYRERLRTRFMRTVNKLGAQLEQLGKWPEVIEVYQRVIELDPLAEHGYRRLMAALQHQGRHAEAMDVFRRCRDMLSIILGIAPSPETQRLFESVQDAAASARPADPDRAIRSGQR
jgi:LuxR family transcriptional regulator, maltose regulon positive regulatory protein